MAADREAASRSTRYVHGHHEAVLRSHRWRTAANSAAYLLDEVQQDMDVLDVGCGPGTITADLAELVPEGSVTGVDTHPGILEQARSACAERGLRNTGFATADVHALDFPDDTFSVVHAHQTLQHLGDPVRALREMRRVCRPGGAVAVRDADYSAMFWYPRLPGLDVWRQLYLRVASAGGGTPDAGRQLHAWARESGCAEVTVSTSTWCFSTPEERSWWSGLWAERTLESSYARLALDGGHTTRSELEHIASSWREWGAHQDGWFTVPHGEILARA